MGCKHVQATMLRVCMSVHYMDLDLRYFGELAYRCRAAWGLSVPIHFFNTEARRDAQSAAALYSTVEHVACHCRH